MIWLLTAIICVAGVCRPHQTKYTTHHACIQAEQAVKGHGVTVHCHPQVQMAKAELCRILTPLQVENGTDRLTLYSSLDVTLDKPRAGACPRAKRCGQPARSEMGTGSKGLVNPHVPNMLDFVYSWWMSAGSRLSSWAVRWLT